MTRMHDKENPEWTEKDFKKARPAPEVLPKLAKKVRQKAQAKSQTIVRRRRENRVDKPHK
ncbi:MAG: hypothetical protein EXS64_04530 [Candidatus Latescibacteria bacterium]|nr:hypothetical protein [Candidatus Latescibacterota bacterium]